MITRTEAMILIDRAITAAIRPFDNSVSAADAGEALAQLAPEAALRPLLAMVAPAFMRDLLADD
ncbi:hypothetical protein [Pseudonocardia xishanensis]|uniref:Uncharacterized protein n=1 Tax=Pseudonocardia xishanensis TaxID=630995 RepID=A0ABP8RRK0_9PSEU